MSDLNDPDAAKRSPKDIDQATPAQSGSGSVVLDSTPNNAATSGRPQPDLTLPDRSTRGPVALDPTVLNVIAPDVVAELAGADRPELVWRNEAGGLTFRAGDRFVKWNPRSTGVDLERERVRLEWLSERFPAPRVLDFGVDDGVHRDRGEPTQWMVTAALVGESVAPPPWLGRPSRSPSTAIGAIATGLRAIHALAIDDFPMEWTIESGAPQSWVERRPESLGPSPVLDDPVIVHGDACAPNTLVGRDGEWVGNVDFGDLAIGDRWADLAIAAVSIGWNFGDGHDGEFYDAYGIEPNDERISYYRALWNLES